MNVSAGQVLRSLPTFSGWSTEAVNGLLQRARKVRFFADDVLFREGEPGSSLFVVLDGEVRITLRAGDRSVTLAQEGPGAILGEMSLIDPGPRSATAIAVSSGTCLGLSALELEELQWDDPPLASALLRAFTRTLAARIRDADGRIGKLSGGRADDRTAGVLRTLWMGAVPITGEPQETRSIPPELPDPGPISLDAAVLRRFSLRAGAHSVLGDGGPFEAFSEEELAALASRLDTVERRAGEVVREDRDRSAWLLLGGGILAAWRGPRGETIDLGALSPGSLFGDLALLLDLPEPVVLVADTPCQLARLDRAAFWRWTESGEPAAVQFHRMLARTLARRLRVANQGFVGMQAEDDEPQSLL